MKQILVTLALICTALRAGAQAHNQFLGVSIQEPVDNFVQQLMDKGLVVETPDNDRTLTLRGSVLGVEGCTVLVERDLTKVEVLMPGANTWKALEAKYNRQKGDLLKQYGKPFFELEDFGTYLPPKTDAEKLKAIQQGDGNWESYWNTEGGQIRLSIWDGRNPMVLRVVYTDKLNQAAAREKQK